MDGIIMLSNMQDDIFSLGHASCFCCEMVFVCTMGHKLGADEETSGQKPEMYKAKSGIPLQ